MFGTVQSRAAERRINSILVELFLLLHGAGSASAAHFHQRFYTAFPGAIMNRITDNSFHYTPSFATDLRKSFRRIKAAQKLKVVASEGAPINGDNRSVISIKTRGLPAKGSG